MFCPRGTSLSTAYCRNSFSANEVQGSGHRVTPLAEQLLLVPEGGVEAWSVDPHGPGQLRERGTLVPACPEHLQCPVQCLIHVELSRAPRRHGDLLQEKCCWPLTGLVGPIHFHCTRRYN